MKQAVAKLSGVSAIALLASGVFGVDVSQACVATAQTTGAGTFTTSSVAVVCNTTVTTHLFDTSFDTFAETSGSYNAYDGSGNDTLNISDGIINGTTLNPEPRLANTIDPSFNAYLNTQPTFVSMNAGNDVVTMSGGTLTGGLLLSDGNDQLNMTGGTISGAIFGDDAVAGDDILNIGGTATVGGTVYGGDGADQVTISGTAQIGVSTGEDDSVGLEEGDDTFTMTGGQLTGGVSGGVGADQLTLSGGSVGDFVAGGDGDDTIALSGTIAVTNNVSAGDDDDTVTMSGGTVGTFLDLGSGADSFSMTGGTVVGNVTLSADQVTVEANQVSVAGGTIGGEIIGGAGVDTIAISGGTVALAVSGQGGDDVLTVSGGNLQRELSGNGGNDTFNLSGGTIANGAYGNAGNDTFIVSGNAVINTALFDDQGNNSLDMSGGTVNGNASLSGTGSNQIVVRGGQVSGSVNGGDGADTIAVSAGTVTGAVFGGGGNDTMTLSGTAAVGSFLGGDGNNTLTMTGGTINGILSSGVGTDTISVSGGTINGDISAGDGNDVLTVSGGNIAGGVFGSTGDDTITISGGTIGGDVDAETIYLLGGTIGGDITGLTGNTLVIQSGSALNLRDGVLFQGTNAVGTVTASNLAQSNGAGAFQSQVFNGFSTLGLDGSTVGFTADQTIASLLLANGSTLFTSGQVNLLSPAGGLGSLSIVNSTISFINGTPTDQFTVGNLTLNNATIGIDVNQATAQADQLVTTGTFNATGVNVVQVNLIGTPQFGTITIVPVGGEAVPTSGTGSPLFTVVGIPQTAGSLFNYQIINGANGGVYLRSEAIDVGTPNATRMAIDAMPLETATSSMLDIGNDAIATELGLAVSGSRSDAAPAFGIYSSGQLAHVEHDGFDISGPGFSGTGPSFSSNDFSLAASVELDAAKYWGFDNQYGLNLGLFGGYASTDVKMDPTALFADVGNASNDSGMIGGYGLFRQGMSYGLVAATGFFGQTDVNNGVLNSTGGYDTAGYAVTGSVGRIFALNERLRFDLRGGVLGATFEGDPYTDTIGVTYGRSRVSFGAVKFEPGIYGDFKLDNGMVASPYARMELQQRFGYSNTGSIQDVNLEFDDADFSAAFSGGVNVLVAPKTTLSGEVRGKFSADSQTVAGKIGLKVKF